MEQKDFYDEHNNHPLPDPEPTCQSTSTDHFQQALKLC